MLQPRELVVRPLSSPRRVDASGATSFRRIYGRRRSRYRGVGVDTPKGGPFGLASHRLGALPLINHFLDRIGLDAALARWLPPPDRRLRLDPAAPGPVVRGDRPGGAAPGAVRG